MDWLITTLDWLTTPDRIAAIIQICILIILTLTFLHASRPHVGVIRADALYDQNTKDFTVEIKIKNTGNVPANNIQSNMRMFHNGKELSGNEGKSKYVLFPSQENSGNPKFHNVEESNLKNDEFKIIVELKYEQPISSFLPIPVTTRKYKTVQELEYDYSYGKFATIHGYAT